MLRVRFVSVTLYSVTGLLVKNGGVWCLSCAMFQSCGKTSDFSLNYTIILTLNTYLMHLLWAEELNQNLSLFTSLPKQTLSGVKPFTEAALPSLGLAAKAEVFEFRPGRVPDTKQFRTHSCSLLRPADWKSLQNFIEVNWPEITLFCHYQKRSITNSMCIFMSEISSKSPRTYIHIVGNNIFVLAIGLINQEKPSK